MIYESRSKTLPLPLCMVAVRLLLFYHFSAQMSMAYSKSFYFM